MDTRLRVSIAVCSLLLLLAVVSTPAFAAPIHGKQDLDIPGVLPSLGQWLSGSSNPDPIPATTDSAYPLTSNDQPVPLAADIKETIMNKTIMYSGAAYCPSVAAGKWTCGFYCEANPDFVLSYSGGDGSVEQSFFVGWNPTSKEIVVARQGSNFYHLTTYLYSADFLPRKLNAEAVKTFSRLPDSSRSASAQIPVGPLSKSLPSTSSGTELTEHAIVNMGFQSAWSKTYADVKTQVQALLEAHPDAVRVFVAGHSLGATIAVLDGIALRNVAPTSVQVEVSVTGQLRVGNPVFATLLDHLVQTPAENFIYHRVTNHADMFPHLFPMMFGYQHSSNEIWIPEAHSKSASPAVLCPGQENKNCADSLAMNTTVLDHIGPYFGLYVGVNCSTAAF
ncbi:hypothetical protein CF327_g6915 [Tilletia walkeri]|nr:hypothetical protein CF327_g6915 [Tilletia walkeri]